MANKFYAVKSGRTTGIFTSWEDCKKQVDGYPNASYKSFKTANEAAMFLGFGTEDTNTKVSVSDKNNINNITEIEITHNLDINTSDTAIAYVDGSYNITTGEYGYGVVFFYQNKEIHLKQGYSNDALASMRNVAGEIKGSEAAIRYALENEISSIKIYHDYEGIAKWCTGEWKANKEGTIAYKDFFDKVKKQIHIEFVKVKGHSGDKYNDVADRLAKEAANVE